MDFRRQLPNGSSGLTRCRGYAAKNAAIALLLSAVPLAAFAQKPDLVPDVADVRVQYNAPVAAGDVAENCAGATTGRDLVRMSLITRNNGPGNMDVGDPKCPDCKDPKNANQICGNPDFICSPAGGHNHPHYNNFLEYEVVDPNGVVVAVGGKRSFCLEETACPGKPYAGGHTCTNQGLDAGCYDIYPFTLGCQYVDVTALPNGDYALRVTVDPLDRFDEVDETNNVITQPIQIQRVLAEDASLAGKGLSLQVGKVLKVSARSTASVVLAGSQNDPTTAGAAVYVADLVGGDQIGFPLPAANWRRAGDPQDPRAFVYNAKASDLYPCTSVKVTRKGVKLKCMLDGTHAFFSLPAEGEVFVRLEVGAAPRIMCASFGGVTKRNDAFVLKRKKAPPASCDLLE